MLLSLRANHLDWTEVIPSLRSAPSTASKPSRQKEIPSGNMVR